jgi:hypothetical protein
MEIIFLLAAERYYIAEYENVTNIKILKRNMITKKRPGSYRPQ